MRDINALFNQQPSEDELRSAPFIKAWTLKARPLGRFWPQLWGWIYGHPTVGEGNYAHTSPVIALDVSVPPRWARTESRLYRLGDVCGPVEWEIRLLARSLKIHGERTKQDDIDDAIDARNDPDGHPGLPLDEVEQMIVNIRRFRKGRITSQRVDSLLTAYRAEKYPPSPEDLARWEDEE